MARLEWKAGGGEPRIALISRIAGRRFEAITFGGLVGAFGPLGIDANTVATKNLLALPKRFLDLQKASLSLCRGWLTLTSIADRFDGNGKSCGCEPKRKKREER